MAKGLVLAFHKEDDEGLFEQILLALKAGYGLVSAAELEQLLLQKKNTSGICHVTFDDGHRSFYETVFPLLKKHQVPVSLFVSPEIISSETNFWFQEMEGYDESVLKNILADELNIALRSLDPYAAMDIFKCLPIGHITRIIERYQRQTGCGKKQPQNMNRVQLKELDASGLVNIGAHSMQHPVLQNERDESSFTEINRSVTELGKLLGRPVRYFAYPNGRPGIDFAGREMNYLAQSGISMAFSTELDTISAIKNLLAVPRMGFARMGLSPSNPLIKFRLNLGKKWIDIRSIGKPSEREIRNRIKKIIGG